MITDKRNDNGQFVNDDDAARKDDPQPEQPAPAPESAEERLDRLQREALRSGTARSAFDG